MPKISVIVPNFNHAQFLPQRLESIFNQTWQDFEVILLDDCSTDNSREILDKYSGHPKVFQSVYNEKNSGSPFKQWKKGIELANGEFIWIAESDDWADARFLETLLLRLENGADLVYCRSVKVDENGEKINDEFWPDSLHDKRWRNDYENSGMDEIYNYLAYRTTIPNASSCVFRNRKGIFTEEIVNSKFTGDWLFWVNYLKNGQLSFVGEPLNYHRLHKGATRSRKDVESRLLRLEERLRAIKLARTISKKGRISPSEFRKYKYLIRSLSGLKKEAGLKKVIQKVPLELLFYTYLYDINMARHRVLGNL